MQADDRTYFDRKFDMIKTRATSKITLLGIVLSIGTYLLGPVDLGRTLYNTALGDTPIFKKELLDFSRRDLQRQNPSFNPQRIDNILSYEFNYDLKKEETIDPQKVSTRKLLDASEVHARSWYQKWIWTDLDD